MPARFDLLLLDLDGTLVDSQAILVGLVNDTLEAAGYARAAIPAVAGSIGLPLEEVFRRAAPAAGNGTIAALCTYYRSRADAPEFVRQFRLYAGVASTLDALRRYGMHAVDVLRALQPDFVIDRFTALRELLIR